MEFRCRREHLRSPTGGPGARTASSSRDRICLHSGVLKPFGILGSPSYLQVHFDQSTQLCHAHNGPGEHSRLPNRCLSLPVPVCMADISANANTQSHCLAMINGQLLVHLMKLDESISIEPFYSKWSFEIDKNQKWQNTQSIKRVPFFTFPHLLRLQAGLLSC